MSDTHQQFIELSSSATANLEPYTMYFNYNVLLKAYANYMQATHGDNTTEAPPGPLNKDLYKWKAWKALEGKSVDDAEKDYVDILTDFNMQLNACECEKME